MTTAATDLDQRLLAALAAQRERRLADLGRLVAIPSVSADPAAAGAVREAAGACRDLLVGAGVADAELVEVPGGPPAVVGTVRSGRDGAPTVLLYAHYDVQPVDAGAWTTEPFAAVLRDGRLHGRGAADDKHGVVSIAWVLDAWREVAGGPPVDVVVVLEGEEEVGSPNLAALLDALGDRAQADVVVVDDAVNLAAGQGLLTAALRGIITWTVEARSLRASGQHAGLYGGLLPDPRMALAKLLAGLVDDRGVPAVPGLDATAAVAHPDAGAFDEAALRDAVGLLDGVPLSGDPAVPPPLRPWTRPALTVLGIDGPAPDGAPQTIAAAARARISLRTVPGQDAAEVDAALRRHVEAERPLGVAVTVTTEEVVEPYAVDLAHPAVQVALGCLADAYGTAPVVSGLGGSIGLIGPLARRLPGAPILLVGAADPRSNLHGGDESLPVEDWQATTTALALLLGRLAGPAPL